MCQYLSFIVRIEDAKPFVGDLRSHDGVAPAWGLAVETYREAEWIGDAPGMLTVRGLTHDEGDDLRERLLRRFDTRTALLSILREGMANGHRFWYQDGKLHRTDGPAVEHADGNRRWYQYGKLHRTDGPAIEYANGDREWYQDGKRISEVRDGSS